MLWLNDSREQIKKDNPGIKVTEIAKKAGEMWKVLKDKTKWEELAAKDKQRYHDEMKDYKPPVSEESGAKSAGAVKKRKKELPAKKSPASTSGFKSKEYISDDESSSDNGGKKGEPGAGSEPVKKKRKTVS